MSTTARVRHALDGSPLRTRRPRSPARPRQTTPAPEQPPGPGHRGPLSLKGRDATADPARRQRVRPGRRSGCGKSTFAARYLAFSMVPTAGGAATSTVVLDYLQRCPSPEPAIEELGPDEADVALEGGRVDRLELVRKLAQLGQGFVLVLVRVVEDRRLAHSSAVVVQCLQPEVDGGVGEPGFPVGQDVVDLSGIRLDAESPLPTWHQVAVVVPGELIEEATG